MRLLVVTVLFVVKHGSMDDFMPLMLSNARNSLSLEKDCLQFDVCRSLDDESLVFLYEVYTRAEAFDVHLASGHFREFERQSRDYIASRHVERLMRVSTEPAITTGGIA